MIKDPFPSLLRTRKFIIFLISFIGLFLFIPKQSQIEFAFVEPGLTEAGWHDVIITAVNIETAAQLVQDTGGVLTSRLQLIDAVGAILSNEQIQQLSKQPAIRSIVVNKQVSTADIPIKFSSDNENDDSDRSYGSDRRRTLAIYDIGSKFRVSPLLLPDGGIFIISEEGQAFILNADGSQRASLTLSGKPFEVPALSDSSGNIYVAGEDKRVYALDANGTILWQFEDDETIKGGLALFESESNERILYVLNEKNIMTALNAANGQEQWQFEYKGNGAGDTKTPPLVGSDGTIYMLTEKGHLVALRDNNQDVDVKWVFSAKSDDYKYPLQFTQDGAIILANQKEYVYVINPDGDVQFRFKSKKSITAVPTVGDDDSLYIVAEEYFYALNPDGSVRYRFSSPEGGKFESSPALSNDGQQVYLALKDGWLYSLDTHTGTILWQYQTEDDLISKPVVETKGHNIHLMIKNGRYVILSADGTLLYTTMRAGVATLPPALTQDERIAIILTESQKVEAVSLLPDSWDDGTYLLPTNNPTKWKFSTISSIDVGADVLHDNLLQVNGVTGNNVTIAVIDSGVTFDPALRNLAGSQIQNIFQGQVDFVGNGECTSNKSGFTQYDTYCMTTHTTAQDPYGHGSHIAGIIWNNFRDADTDVMVGVAPDANILSVRVLNEDGLGTYEDIIEGIQFVVEHQDDYNVRVINLSLSALATTPYFADPLNRAVEAAWANGITVVTAAGNNGDAAHSVTVPGNDPYVITVGAVNTNNTPGYWGDDTLPSWSSVGPTLDGFIKPDVLAPGTNVISFIDANEADGMSAQLAQTYPHLAETNTFFRMSGTSTATAVTSGVVALMLEANPNLTPDEVKFRLMYTAKTAVNDTGDSLYSILQQGLGRIWAPDAVLGNLPQSSANQGMDLQAELTHPWLPGDSTDPAQNPDLAMHYQGPIQQMFSDDGQVMMYHLPDANTGNPVILGMVDVEDYSWIDPLTYPEALTFENGRVWNESYGWSGGTYAWSGGTYAWSGGTYA